MATNKITTQVICDNDNYAGEVSVDSTQFSGNLSISDTDVQKALETIDQLDLSGGGSGTDFHNSYEEILSDEIITIVSRKQMVVFQELDLSGELRIEGSLFLEA